MEPEGIALYDNDVGVVTGMVLDARPEFASELGRVMYFWAEVEHALTRLLAALLKVDLDRARIIFMTFNSNAAKLDLMQRLAHIYVPEGKPRDRVLEALSSAADLNASRNSFVHATWAMQGTNVVRFDGSLAGSRAKAYREGEVVTIERIQGFTSTAAVLIPIIDRVRYALEKNGDVQGQPIEKLYHRTVKP